MCMATEAIDFDSDRDFVSNFNSHYCIAFSYLLLLLRVLYLVYIRVLFLFLRFFAMIFFVTAVVRNYYFYAK